MSISALHVGNFKGIKDDIWIDIKPITLFIGRNSSGKSSCIHALTSLSQTMKLPNNNRPLILDDEYASIHLGRFIEVIHTKSYSDAIKLGLRLDSVPFAARENRRRTRLKAKAEAIYEFKCTKRTQDLYLDRAEFTIGDFKYTSKRKKDNSYETVYVKDNTKVKCNIKDGFILERSSFMEATDEDSFYKLVPFFAFQREIQSELQNSQYLGPFRQSPIRRYPTRGSSPIEVGAQGESTATLLANEIIQSRTRTHIGQIAK